MTPAEREQSEWLKLVERVNRDCVRTHARVERRIPRYERKLAAARAKIAAKNENGT